MFVLGAVLFSSTVLSCLSSLPNADGLHGHRAAGMVISMAAVLLVFLLPFRRTPLQGTFSKPGTFFAFGWITLARSHVFLVQTH